MGKSRVAPTPTFTRQQARHLRRVRAQILKSIEIAQMVALLGLRESVLRRPSRRRKAVA
jgi:hypothetical protein